jgi:hypothetical protein
LPPQGCIFRAVLANKLLVLGDVITHRVNLVLLRTAISSDEVSLCVVLTTQQANRRKRKATARQCGRERSQDVRAITQHGIRKDVAGSR